MTHIADIPEVSSGTLPAGIVSVMSANTDTGWPDSTNLLMACTNYNKVNC